MKSGANAMISTRSILRSGARITCLGAALAAALALADCAGEPGRRLPGGYRLIQKDQYQALYGPDGRIQRLLQDRNHDGRAEAVVVYGPNGKPERGELDTDADGVVDRWEYFRADSTLEKIAVSRRRTGRPDRWEHVGPDGRVYQIDFDEDGDGKVDRSEYPR
jgi:hypothetical protein